LSAALHRRGLLSEARYKRILSQDPDIIVWDLRRGIPFADATFDVVYHSHLLEHLDRDVAPLFLRECLRVVKPGGILRVVVPDLEWLSRRYLERLESYPGSASAADVEAAAAAIFDQMIVRTPAVRREQPLPTRAIEKVLLGDTARHGAAHRWMYDHVSLAHLLENVGFTPTGSYTHDTSRVDGWVGFGLDTEPDGTAYKPESLYLEAEPGQGVGPAR
jgi:SAM-dependent methyltransferase